MSGIPDNKCGFMFLEDHKEGDRPRHQSCCYRDVLPDTDRCAWHATPEETDEKTIDALQKSRVPPEVRGQTSPVGELLDGAILSEAKLNDSIPLKRVALREADLSDADLSRADLSDAVLTGADLSNADLVGANLSDAFLTGADLSGAHLSLADLSEAILEEAHLSEAILIGADLSDADLPGADLSDADLPVSDLSKAFLPGAELSKAYLLEANLSEAMLPEANLSEAILTKANLTEAGLKEADLSDAILNKANLTAAELKGADLCGTVFLKTTLRETSLPKGRVLRKADLTEADLQGQDFREEDLSGTRLAKADLTDSDLSRANLSGANLERALLNRADLFDTRLAGARLQGAVFGNVQINEETFERLAPEAEAKEDGRNLGERLRTLVLGPTGHDDYRCVYDPASQFELPETKGEESDSEGSDDIAENNSGREQRDPDPEVQAGAVYRQFERLAGENALPRWQRRFFVLRQDMQTRKTSGLGYAFAVVQRVLFGYGESFGRIVGWSGVIIAAFSAVYLAGGWIQPVEAGGNLGQPLSWTLIPGDPSVLWESIYYSTLTFTALGFGDFRPVGSLGQLLTILETAGGALLMALLVWVLGRRAAR